MLPLKKLTSFTDKKEVQRTATALGYVAHVALLVASDLKVHLRYPIRLGGSCSYIMDPAPSVDASSCDIYLQPQDLEQLLNFIGVRSSGPRHVLGNLKELYRTIISPEYLD